MGQLVADTGALKPAALGISVLWVIPRIIEVFTVRLLFQPAIALFFGRFI